MAEITSAEAIGSVQCVFHPRKSRLVLDNIRGKSVADLIANLTFTQTKLLGSSESFELSVANAENNFGLES